MLFDVLADQHFESMSGHSKETSTKL